MKNRILGTAILFLASFAAATAQGPAGTWKLSVPRSNLTFLVRLDEKDGKWSAQYLGATVPELAKLTIGETTVTADSVRFSIRIPPGRELSFDGKLPADPKTGRVFGTLQTAGNEMILVHLEPSKLKAFDKYALDKEVIEQATEADALLQAALDLIRAGGDKQAKIEEVRGWADKAFRPAEAYGLRWQCSAATQLAQALLNNKAFGPVAVEYARKAERLLDPGLDANLQMGVLETVSRILATAGRADDAKQIDARLSKLEERDYADYQKRRPFKADAFAGRKGKSDRAVVVELFTGAECPPCVAADLAFDALESTYKPTEVVLLQYHVHIPGPDPLTSADTMARLQYYGRKIEGTPTVFFNGKPDAPGGGGAAAARKKYAEFRELIEPLLEKNADAKLQLTATRKAETVDIQAKVEDCARVGDKIRLRLMLVEDIVRYQGGNALKYHHCVVRALPGGPLGMAVTKKPFDHSATINLEDLRTRTNDYLTSFARENEIEFPRPDRPMRYKKLRVVALVQDDDNGEILQAMQVEVK
jgi:hypothetical protein